MRNTPPPPRRVRTAHQSKSAAVRAAAAAPSRRQQSKWQREQHHQLRLYIAVGVLAIIIAGIFVGGIVYDNVVRANEIVAQIGPDTISASQLLDQVRPAARSLDAQAKQYGGGTSIAQYIDQQKRSLPDQTLSSVIDQHLIEQEAARRSISVSPSELDDKQRQTVADFQAASNPSPTPEPAPTADSTGAPDAAATPNGSLAPDTGATPSAALVGTSATPDAAAASGPTAVPTPASPTAVTTPTPVPTLTADGYAPALQQLLDKNGLSEADLRDRLQTNMLRDKLQTAIGQEQFPDTQEEVHARHILVATPEQANDVLTQLQGGADFATLAAQLSIDPGSKDKGGDLGWFARGVMDKPFEDAAFALQPGQLSDVVHGANGYHVIQVLERDAARAIPADQLTTQRSKAFSDWLATRRSSQDVKLQLSQSERDWILGRIGIRP